MQHLQPVLSVAATSWQLLEDLDGLQHSLTLLLLPKSRRCLGPLLAKCGHAFTLSAFGSGLADRRRQRGLLLNLDALLPLAVDL